MHKYATTTPEARELVSELEFVWDQIKSNSTSSAASSPGQIERSQGQQITNPSYASIGGPSARGAGRVDGGSGGGLRMLRPVSDGDEEENEEDEEDEDFVGARPGTYDDQDLAVVDARGQSRDLDVRNRKWRKRVEQALVKMTTEVAALREQIESKNIGNGKRRNGVWAWMVWLVWVSVRHMLLDLTILGIVLVWARRKRDRRVDMGLGLLVQYLREQIGRLIKPLKLPDQAQ